MMITCNLIVEGRRETQLELPEVPRRGDLISNVNPKLPVYLVHRIEFVSGFDGPNIHVQKFANQLSAVINVDGFRNKRGWL